MRVLYFFVSKGAAPYESKPAWNPKKFINDSDLMLNLQTEGTFYMLDKLQEMGVIDTLMIVIESSADPGKAVFGRHKGIVVPELSEMTQFLKEDDVLFIRGGWRGWWAWLNDQKGKHWLMNYAANTGRQRWNFWDVQFWDCEDVFVLDRLRRLWVTFRKPTHPGIFKDMNLAPVYDICIGASYIHTKKGQWRMVHILKEYRKMFGELPKCVMPGALRSAAGTQRIIDNSADLEIEMPGMLEREDLATVFNQSKIAVFLGTSGQNDRGPLEAMQCGCQLIIGSPKYHSPVVYNNSDIQWVPDHIEDYKGIAGEIHEMLSNYESHKRQEVLDWNSREAHVDTVTIPAMSKIFSFIKENPKPDTRGLYNAIKNSS